MVLAKNLHFLQPFSKGLSAETLIKMKNNIRFSKNTLPKRFTGSWDYTMYLHCITTKIRSKIKKGKNRFL